MYSIFKSLNTTFNCNFSLFVLFERRLFSPFFDIILLLTSSFSHEPLEPHVAQRLFCVAQKNSWIVYNMKTEKYNVSKEYNVTDKYTCNKPYSHQYTFVKLYTNSRSKYIQRLCTEIDLMNSVSYLNDLLACSNLISDSTEKSKKHLNTKNNNNLN